MKRSERLSSALRGNGRRSRTPLPPTGARAADATAFLANPPNTRALPGPRCLPRLSSAATGKINVQVAQNVEICSANTLPVNRLSVTVW